MGFAVLHVVGAHEPLRQRQADVLHPAGGEDLRARRDHGPAVRGERREQLAGPVYLEDAVQVLDFDPFQLPSLRIPVQVRGEEPDYLGGPAPVGDLEDALCVEAPTLCPVAPGAHNDRARVHQHAVQVEEDRLTLEGSHKNPSSRSAVSLPLLPTRSASRPRVHARTTGPRVPSHLRTVQGRYFFVRALYRDEYSFCREHLRARERDSRRTGKHTACCATLTLYPHRLWVSCGRPRVRRGTIVRTTEAERGRAERRQRAAAEIQNMLADLYRGFVAWASLYGDVDGPYEQDQRERVTDLVDRLSNGYLARSMWLEPRARKRIEDFIEKAEDLYSSFCAEIEERGYTRAKKSMATRVSRQLGSLRKVAESNLKDDPGGPRRPRWRMRLGRS